MGAKNWKTCKIQRLEISFDMNHKSQLLHVSTHSGVKKTHAKPPFLWLSHHFHDLTQHFRTSPSTENQSFQVVQPSSGVLMRTTGWRPAGGGASGGTLRPGRLHMMYYVTHAVDVLICCAECMYIHKYIFFFIHVYVCIYIYILIYVYVFVYIYIHTCITLPSSFM